MYDVELIELNKKYRNVIAVEDVSLNIKQGEFLFLLGPSGCGKTTILRMIGGMEEPTTGMVRIQGEDVSNIPPEKRVTSTVFQNWALFPHKTVSENVGFGLAMQKIPKATIKAEVTKYLEMVGLADLSNRYPNQLSGGQKQRVALARALIVKPAVLLLDEPLSALDLKLRNQMRFEIKRIQRKLAVTAIFVTHDQTEALAMADRIVIMNKGRIEQIGTPSEIYFNPMTKFVSDFVGEMNFLQCKLVKQNADTTTVELSDNCRIDVASTHSNQNKTQVTIGIRPEKIFVKREPSVSDGCILLEGKLEEITFLGQLLRFHVTFEGNMIIVDDFGGVNRALRYQESENVYMEINPKDCLLIPDHNDNL
ncbi:MAG: ABC transporter ATP-binding protein [Deltaproteobacteria bacterium]|jgi:spermidine/putrescine ABC transporter ATP-binding subunit|nr:ABC transporter ATP-binding protein [Deltaproteobacteria bacterium]MBT4878119.1 ABC transporter ATP-binding protein [Desulfobacula sp.]MBT4640554.1 ABC transporter ATP-binding protein [Deltaproteobacteria bacterium]MBT5546606.1 ABC transporter ATP-binding protein [Desulfobacula sp.]MBT6616402.1 ABC transporter ATP-binding protein [Deltaproteobacteria bacterium]